MGTPAAQTSMQPYLDTVGTLWPGSAPGVDRSARSDRAEFLVVPSRRAPRLLVPRHNHAAASAAMLRFSSALTVRDTAKRLAVAGALRGRLDLLFPDRLVFDDVRPAITGQLED